MRVVLMAVVVLVLGGCVGEGAGAPRGHVVIAAGGTQGVYYAYAHALASQLQRRDPDLRVDVVATSGSMENLQRLGDGDATFAFTAADAAAEAVSGGPPFGRRVPIAALARLYDDYLHLVAPAAGVRRLSQLAGKRVSIGPPGSGTRLIASRLRLPRLHAVGLGLDESAAALRAGRIDAFFWSGGLPTPGVDELARQMPLRLLDLPAPADPDYRAAAIPSGTYGLGRQVSTLAVPNLLVARRDADPALVRLVTATLFERRTAIARAVLAAAALDRRAAIETAPVPLHAAALDWFRATKP
nr:TAXI family TRAP transporter solute-binding subunit [Solirubrobacter soli]